MKSITTVALLLALTSANLSPVAMAQDKNSQNSLVRHFVAFKFKADTTDAQKQEIDQALLALKDKIPVIISIEHGNNCSDEKLNHGFDDGFIITFKNLQARDIYLTHTEHEKFKAMALPKISEAFAFDLMAQADKSAEPKVLKLVDLTHVLGPDLPDFHLGNTAFTYKMLFTIAKDGYGDGVFTTPEHYGTHMDAPRHFYESGMSIDEIPASKLLVPALVIDVRADVKANSDYRLTLDKIKAFEERGAIPAGSAVLLLTGFSHRFGDPKAYRNADEKGIMHFPGFSEEAANYLIKTKKVSALGIDTLSADYGLSPDFPVHRLALKEGAVMIENLNNLDKLPARHATIFLGALRIKGGTGSPARILALVPED